MAGDAPRSAPAGLLLAALVSQFTVDFAVSALRLRFGRGIRLGEQLRESLWIYAIDAALSPVAWAVGMMAHTSTIVAGLSPLPLIGLLSVFGRERLDGALELNRATEEPRLVLGDVVESDDGYTGQHCRSVVALAMDVGDRLGPDPERRRNLEFAALLHDIGKIVIPKNIINKPGPLEPHEWDIVRTHPLEGQRMLDRVGGLMRGIGRIVRAHHERWDGGGYPDGLVGEDIPLEERIITCCDSWNAMRTDRPYRRAPSVEVAVAEMTTNRGTQFDPDIVTALLEAISPEVNALPGGGEGGWECRDGRYR